MAAKMATERLGESNSASEEKISYAEFLALRDVEYAEWVDGVAIPMAPPFDQHQDVSLFLASILRHYAEAKDLGVVREAPYQMKGPGNMPGREPDILFISKERMARIKKNYLDGPADLVIEIISTESRVRDREEKLLEYQQIGVAEYWIIDPESKDAAFFQLGPNGTYQQFEPDADGIFHSPTLEGLWLKMDWLWQDRLPTLMSILRQWGLVTG